MNMTLTILVITLAAGFVVAAMRRVPIGQVHSLYRRGQPLRLLEPGTHWVVPGLDRIGHRIDLAGQVLQFEQCPADTGGLRGTVYWQVLEPERADALIDEAPQFIRRGALAALAEAPEIAADRRDLGSRMKQALNGALRERGLMVTRVELDIA
ncbi:MAG: hypothetical protein KGN77_13885 [Xanthomonadaceae bacterium]|nr:hypothetical protein [Xanthomonadaceae bacterium]MDE1964244.1 hypothetical protein [Xanthomonadaceae bacterium]